MKRNAVHPLLVAAALLFAGSAAAQAQNYHPVRFNLGIIVPHAPGLGAWGFGGVLEGKYNIHDRVAAGIRLDGSAQLGGTVGSSTASINIAAVAAFLAKGEYFFTDTDARPFVGLGLGVYTLGGQSVSAGPGSAGVTQAAGTVFGFAPQVGVDLGIVRLAVTYNWLLGGDLVTQSVGVGTTAPDVRVSRNYLSFELSFRIGGGRKDVPAETASPGDTTTPPPGTTSPAI